MVQERCRFQWGLLFLSGLERPIKSSRFPSESEELFGKSWLQDINKRNIFLWYF